MADFDAVLFDAGGVLVVPSPEAVGPTIARFGGDSSVETLYRAHFVAAHAMDNARADGTEADWHAYARGYTAAAGIEGDEEAIEAFHAAFDHWMWHHPVPGARDALAGLSERGVPIGIVSNAAGQVEDELSRLGIAAVANDAAVRVACVVDSHVVGVAKPDPRIFEGALAALGMPASARIAYVGDTVFYDVRAAAAAGLTPLLHDPFGFHLADPHPSGPHRTLPGLEALHDLVRPVRPV